MRMFRTATILLALSGAGMLAQDVDISLIEVASVKPVARPAVIGPTQFLPGGRFVAPTATVAELIGVAYQVQDYQVIAADDWIRSELFSVNARLRMDTPANPSAADDSYERIALLVRAVLAERFKLRLRNESRTLPTYSLVAARRDKALGPRLTPSQANCREDGELLKTPQIRCGLHVFTNRLLGVSVPISTLANVLSGRVNRPVLDETGLEGLFDYELTWAADDVLPANAPRANGQGQSSPEPLGPTGPSLFTALQEQLALRLDAARAPVDVLVVAHVARPSPD